VIRTIRDALLHQSDRGTPPDEATPDGNNPLYCFNFLTKRGYAPRRPTAALNMCGSSMNSQRMLSPAAWPTRVFVGTIESLTARARLPVCLSGPACLYRLLEGIPNMTETNEAAGGGGGDLTREELEREHAKLGSLTRRCLMSPAALRSA
jgi:hypothetical protein